MAGARSSRSAAVQVALVAMRKALEVGELLKKLFLYLVHGCIPLSGVVFLLTRFRFVAEVGSHQLVRCLT